MTRKSKSETLLNDRTDLNVEWSTAFQPTAKGISGKVQRWLFEKPPCTIVKLTDVYNIDKNSSAVRAAVYQHTANTPVFEKRKTRIA